MKFVYKIHSGYDGFTPKRIPERLEKGKLLRLGWERYINAVERGQEVWVYFHGPHKFSNGVYVNGFVHSIDYDKGVVLLRVRESSCDIPLTDHAECARIGQLVSIRYRQVFPLPEQWELEPACTVDSSASTCKARQCGACKVWKTLPLINATNHRWPKALPTTLCDFAPAYWVIPSRCFLFGDGFGEIRRPIKHSSELFYRFKLGEVELAFPLALGMYEALRKREELDFDCIVPIPLSPKKEAAGEIHRTRLLATELSKLLGTRVVECLSLSKAISKRALLSIGFTGSEIEGKYFDALEVSDKIKNYDRILLVDDVCTRGRTIRSAVRKICSIHADAEVAAACAGQMIVKEAVVDSTQLVE